MHYEDELMEERSLADYDSDEEEGGEETKEEMSGFEDTEDEESFYGEN